MYATAILTSAILAASKVAAFGKTPSSCCTPIKPDPKHHQQMAENYLKAWNGDYSIISSTFTPDALLYSDRIVTTDGKGNTNGSIPIALQSAGVIKGFMQLAPQGWDKYQFALVHWAGGSGQNVAVRWTLDGVVGKHFSKPTTLKEGDVVHYNGTDFLQLDECTGLIKQVDMTQDYITFYHNIGLTTIHI